MSQSCYSHYKMLYVGNTEMKLHFPDLFWDVLNPVKKNR